MLLVFSSDMQLLRVFYLYFTIVGYKTSELPRQPRQFLMMAEFIILQRVTDMAFFAEDVQLLARLFSVNHLLVSLLVMSLLFSDFLVSFAVQVLMGGSLYGRLMRDQTRKTSHK